MSQQPSQQPFDDIGDLLTFSTPTVSYTIPSFVDDSNNQSSTTVYDRYYSFPSSSSSSDDDEPSSSSAAAVSAASKRLEYNLQFLDRKLCSSSPPPNHPLPEFAPALGPGSDPIFAPPLRAADFNVPPCLELRPQPLRETQVGRYLRTVVSIENELWAGTECGVRVWRFSDVYKMGNGGEEEGTAPYFESGESSGVMCMVGDEGNRLVWTGHKDGRIRAWKMGQTNNGFREILSWQVSRTPVVSIVLSYYGKPVF